MSAIQRIVERLKRHPALKYRVADGTVTVEPIAASGFSVTLTEGTGEWVVSFDRWHHHCASEEEATQYFVFGLTDRCRLKVRYRGSFPYCWTVEERTGDGWQTVSTTALLCCPFWRRMRVEYFHNAVIRTV